MADGIKTIREQCLEAVEDHFKAQRQGAPATDPYTITWSIVDRADVSDMAHGKAYTLAIFEGNESIDAGLSTLDGVTFKTLTLNVEFRALLNRDQRPSVEANRIIGEIIRRMLEDETLGGLSVWIQEIGNEFFIENVNDRQIEGTVTFNMLYRHSRRDPRSQIC
jgi:hypothetical protein